MIFSLTYTIIIKYFKIAIYSPRAENAFSRPRRFLGTSGTSSQKRQGRENAFSARGLYKAFCTEGILSGSGRENCFSALLILSGSGRENHFSARWSHFSPYYRRAEKYFSRPIGAKIILIDTKLT